MKLSFICKLIANFFLIFVLISPSSGKCFPATLIFPDPHQANSHQSILSTPARRVCRTSCSHAGVAESWLGRSRLLPNCAFQSCCELGVATGLHGATAVDAAPKESNLERVSLICWSKGHRSYASVGWIMATRVAALGSDHSVWVSSHFLVVNFFGFWSFIVCVYVCVKSSLQISFPVWFIRFPFFHYACWDWMIHLSLCFSLSLFPCISPPALHQPTPAIFTPHTSVAALIQPQTAAGSIAKQIIQQQSTSPSPSLPLPLSMHSSSRGSLEAEGPYWAGPRLSTSQALYWGIYGALCC